MKTVALLSGLSDLHQFGSDLKAKVYRHVGIPISIGIGPTKTICKLANHAAKTYPATKGVVELTSRERLIRLMKITDVSEVWGVGRRLTAKLQRLGIKTAYDLSIMPCKEARKRFSVVLERTIRELNLESCIDLEEMPATRKQVVCSRSFGEKLTEYDDVRQAVSEFAARGAERLRSEGLTAACDHIY